MIYFAANYTYAVLVLICPRKTSKPSRSELAAVNGGYKRPRRGKDKKRDRDKGQGDKGP